MKKNKTNSKEITKMKKTDGTLEKYKGTIEFNFMASSLSEANHLTRLFANRVETGTPHKVNIDAYEAEKYKYGR